MMNWAFENQDLLKHRHYTLKGSPPYYFFNLSPRRVDKFRRDRGDEFCLVIIGADRESEDWFAIPYTNITHLLTEDTLELKESRDRWLCKIINGELCVFPGGEGNAANPTARQVVQQWKAVRPTIEST